MKFLKLLLVGGLVVQTTQSIFAQNTLYMNPIKYTDRNLNSYNDNCSDPTKIHYLVNNVEIARTTAYYCCGFHAFSIDYGLMKPGDVFKVTQDCSSIVYSQVVKDDYVYVEVPNGLSYTGNGITATDETAPYTKLSTPVSVGKCETINLNAHGLSEYFIAYYPPNTGLTTGSFTVNAAPVASGATVISPAGHSISSQGVPNITSTVNTNGSITSNGSFKLTSNTALSGNTPINMEYQHNGITVGGDFAFGFGAMFIAGITNTGFKVVKSSTAGVSTETVFAGSYNSALFKITYDGTYYRAYLNGVKIDELRRFVKYASSSGTISLTTPQNYGTGVSWTPSTSGSQWVSTEVDGILYTRQQFTVADDMVLTGSSTNVACFGGNTGSIATSITGGKSPFTYSLNGGAFSSASTFNNLVAGVYTVQAKDASGCTISKSFTLSENALLGLSANKTDITCSGQSDGSVILTASGGSGSYTYSSDGTNYVASNTFSSLSAGVKTFYVKDGAGCVKTVSSTINTQSTIIASISSQTNVVCFGGSTGSVSIGTTGSAPSGTLQYSVGGAFQTAATFTGLTANTYIITVKDNLCQVTLPLTITQASDLIVSPNINNQITCNGLTDGQINVSVTGGTGAYQYSKDNVVFGNNAIFNNLAANGYKFWVKDANGCIKNSNIYTIVEPTAISFSVASKVDVACNGASTGSIILSTSGGTGTYTYSKDGTNFQAPNVFSNLSAGAYTLTVKDANGCTKTASTSILEQTAVVLSQNITNQISCFGGSDGEVTLSATGGAGTYQFSKDNVTYSATAVFTGLNTGTYTFYGKDVNGCIKSIPVILGQPTLLVPSIASQTNVLCKSGSDGAVNVGASGGTSPYQYSKDGTNFQGTIGFTGFTAGTYTFTVKDAKGCVKTINATITEPTLLVATASTTQQVSCFGGNNGTIQVSGSGGTSPYQYSNNGTTYVTSNSFSGLTVGSYSYWVKDANGCVKTTASTLVTQPTDIVFAVASKVDVACNGASTGSITLSTSGGTGTYTYSKDGTNFQAPNVFSNLSAGAYTLTVKDANGCTKTASTSILEQTAVVLSQNITNQISCFGGSDGEVTLSATGGAGTYQYSKDNVTYSATAVFTGLNTGTYTFYGKDVNGCIKSIPVILGQPTLLVPSIASQTNVLCKSGSDGAVNVGASGGTSPYQYSKDGTNFQGTIGFTGFTAGTYTFTVKDAKGCIKTINATITEPTLLVATANTTQQVSCFGGNNGTIQVSGSGGTSPYQYSNNGTTYVTTNSFTGLAVGNYSYWVKDANGCVKTTSSTAVTQPTDIIFAVASKVEVACNGASTGSITLSTSGGTGTYTFSKDGTNFQASNVFSNLSAGAYTLTVKDANGCTKTASTSILEQTAVVLSQNITNQISCFGGSDGEVTLSATGGAGTYQYSKDNVTYSATVVFTGLNTGTYTFYGKDVNGCIKSIPVILGQPTLLVPSIASQTNVLCKSGSDGAVNVGASGGTSPYQYSKDGTNFQGTIGFTGFTAGTYTFTVKDAKGCIKTINATITEPTLLVATANTTQQVSCFGGNNGTIQVSGSDGTSPYQYSNNGTTYVTSNSFSGLTVGSYSYWVKDANGCVKTTASTLVTQPTDILISLSTKSDVKCFGGNDGSLSVTASGGTGTLTYSKDGTNFQGSNNFTNLTAQTYTISVKDQNACMRTFSVQILQPTAFIISSVSNQNLSCFGNNTGRIEVLGTGGTPAYQYSINNSIFQTSTVFAGLGAGTYTVYAKDANNCLFNLANNTINQPSDITVSLLEKVDVDCDYYQKGSMIVGASGGVGSFIYNLTGQDFKFNPVAGQSNASGIFNNLFAGNYVINVQDVTGCIKPFPVTIVPKNSHITFNVVKTLPSNCNSNDGIITINSVGGGNNPYQYRLSSQNIFTSSNTFNNLGNGSYIITVADGLCAYNQSVDLSLPNSLKATYTISPISCAVPNGNLNVTTITGGNGNYSLSLDGTNFSSSTAYNNLTPNVYSLTLKDSPLSCQSVVSFELKEQNRADLTLTNKTDILCNSANTGAIAMIGNNNLGPFSYSLNQKISFGGSGTFTGLNSGTYKVYAKTNIGCVDSLQVTLSQPTTVMGNVTQKDNDCFGDNTANLNASASGGVSPYTYSIDGTNYGTNASFTGLTAGNYTLNIKDANACILPKSVTIVQPSLLVPSTSIGQNVSCFGGTDGSVVVSGTGGTSPYQFSNDNVNFTTNNTFGGLVTNSYTYYVKDAKGCTKQASAITVTQPTLLVPSITSNVNITCFGGSDGQILMAASGGTSPYQYSADQTNYQTGTNLTGLLVGTFTVSVKDAKGCVKNLTQTLTQPNDLIPTPTVTNAVSCFGGNDGKITYSSVGGTSPYQYSADNSTYQSNNYFDNLTAQNYSYWVKDSKGCTKQATAIGVSQPTVLVPSVLNQVNVSCFGGTDGNINLQAIGGTSPYQYSKDGTTFQTITAFTGFSQGSYTFTIKDAKNCIKTLPVTISEPTNLVVSGSVIKNVLCFAGNTGEIQVAGTGGTSPYQYSADGSSYVASNTFVNLTAQAYTYYVKDAKGCVKLTASQTITQPTIIVPSIQSFTNVSCNGGSDGIIEALATGGVSPYQYAITGSYQPSATFNNLLFGSYTVTIKDVNGCTKTVNQTLTQPAPGVASSTVTNNVSCFGGNDGTVSVTTSGGTNPYQYSADNVTFQSSNIFGTLTAQNNYKYYVKDAKGCIQITPVIGVSEPPLLVPAIANQANVLCFAGSTGAIILASTGGTTPYQYSKDGTSYQTSTTFTGFVKGTYTFSIKDSKGCVKTININITEPTDLVVNGVVSKTVLCYAGNTGEISVNGTGGTSPYTYSADGTTYLTNNAFTALTANSYTFYVKDANGCTKQTSPKTVTEPPLLVPRVASISNIKCFGGNDGLINVAATGGVSPYQYSSEPNNFGTDPKLAGFVAGNYTLYVKDANGCVKQTQQDLSQPTILKVGSSVGKNVSCFEGNDGELVVTSEGGVSPYQYALDEISFKDSPNFKELKAKNFIITVKDANNCLQKTSSVGISEPPLLVPNVVSQTDVLCFGGSDGKINTNASGGTSPYLYALDGTTFETNQSFTGLKKQGYVLSVKDSKGCVKTLQVTVNQPKDLLLTAIYQDTIPCFKDAKGVAKLKVLGGVSGYVFSKNGTDYVTDSTFKNLTAGEYQFYVKDANQCEKKVKLQLTEPNQLNLNLVKASDPLCTGDENGKIELLASGGNLGYTYILDNTQKKTVGLFTDLAENEYALQVVDKKDCKQSITPVKLTNPKPLSASVSIEAPKCVGDNNGKITLNMVGGSFPYTAKNVSDSVSFKDVQVFEKLNAGTYRYSINDKNGCRLSLPVKLAEPQTLSAIVFDAPKEVCKGQVITLDAKNPNRTVQWYRNGKEFSKEQKIEISEPDQYSVSVKNTSGCEVIGKYTLVNNANLFNPDFLMAVQAFVGDTVVVLDISKPKPDETKWVLPADAIKMEDNVQRLTFMFGNIGEYEISQLAKKGDCRNTKTRMIKIFKKEDVDNTDPKLGYKDLIKIQKMDVSPNPNYGAFAINVELNLSADIELTITRSTTSAVVYQDKAMGVKDHKFEVQLKNAPQDIYIVTIRAGALTMTKKVLVLN